MARFETFVASLQAEAFEGLVWSFVNVSVHQPALTDMICSLVAGGERFILESNDGAALAEFADWWHAISGDD